jgi:argininosuccinate lyase
MTDSPQPLSPPPKSYDEDKLWGARFQKKANRLLDEFNASICFDYKLFREDIEGSLAHAEMLSRAHVLKEEEFKEIQRALAIVLEEIEIDPRSWALERVSDEDIHLAIERRLTELIGDTAKKLHTARSRNDQVATDLRLWLRKETKTLKNLLINFRETLCEKAIEDMDHIMPGYTHLQHAQPISLGHFWMAHEARFSRDTERLLDALKRINVNPLGSGALAGTSFHIDRIFTTKKLGFDRPSENSLDAVSDRDFVAEYEFTLSLIMIHLSQLAEEMIVWNSSEFGFISISDDFATGSSMMPQKKNPDIPELIRGKTGRVIGVLNALLMTLKSLPLAYNKDLQEDKELLFMANESCQNCISIFNEFLKNIQANKDRMYEGVYQSYADATDVVEYLVRKNIPFRVAYQVVGEIVKYAIERGRLLKELSQSEWGTFHSAFTDDITEILKPENCVAARDIIGGTAKSRVKEAIKFSQDRIKVHAN